MNLPKAKQLHIGVLALAMSACATLPDDYVVSPQVNLTKVRVVGIGFNNQKFLLSFEAENPNPFPIPVRNVGYGVTLDGQRFASGEAESNFTIPAEGDADFAISVDLNLLQTAPQLLSIMRNASRSDIPYQLDGKLSVDIPLAPTLKYQTRGSIRVDSDSY